MGNGRRIIEQIKTVILVVLFLMTILLLYLLWTGDQTVNLADILPFQRSEQNIPEMATILAPAYMITGSGDGSFTVTHKGMDKCFERALNTLQEMSKGNISVGTVSARQCKEAMERYSSSVLVFSCDLPYTQFCSQFGLTGLGTETIGHISRLMVSEAATDSVILFDDASGNVYRIACEGAVLAPETADSGLSDSGIYYGTDMLLGCEGSALIPVGEACSLSICDNVETDLQSSGVDVAKQVFGNTFDFVRRMTDSFGTVTYMYGYGQKTLTVYTDGSFEYKTENTGDSAGFMGDLETALGFVAGCGGWNTDPKISYRLARYTEGGTGRSISYTFSFMALMDGVEICCDEGYPIVVGVSGGKVSYYYRNTIVCDAASQQNEEQVCEAANVIAGNANFMYKILNESALAPNTDEALSFVAEKLENISIGYYHESGSALLLPCRIIDLEGGYRFYFGLYEGTPLGMSE